MKELLRIGMTAGQVREACMEWVEARTNVSEPATITVTGIQDGSAVQVIFSKKRVRNTRSATTGEAK